ncbi:TPA: hypothetical protein ACSK9T_002828, partial [Listeria innocua]
HFLNAFISTKKFFLANTTFSVHSVAAYDTNTINQNTYKRQDDFRYFFNFWTCKGLLFTFMLYFVVKCWIFREKLRECPRRNFVLERVIAFRKSDIIVQLAM